MIPQGMILKNIYIYHVCEKVGIGSFCCLTLPLCIFKLLMLMQEDLDYQ